MVEAKKHTTPAARPMTSAPAGATKPAAGVMPTRPATMPEMMPSTEAFLWTSHSTAAQEQPAAAAAIWVATAVMPAVPLAANSAEPALKPNQPPHSRPDTDDAVDQVMRRERHLAVAAALADHEGDDQARDAGGDMDHGAAGEVEGAEVEEIARTGPDHVADRRVNQQRPQDVEEDQRREFHAVGKGAGDERRGDDGKGHLEEEEDRLRDRAGRACPGPTPDRKALEKSPMKAVARRRRRGYSRPPARPG